LGLGLGLGLARLIEALEDLVDELLCLFLLLPGSGLGLGLELLCLFLLLPETVTVTEISVKRSLL